MNLLSREILVGLREKYPQGTRVELLRMEDPYTDLLPGDLGTVRYVDDAGTIHCQWDRGSGLGVVYGVDLVKIVE